jgi:hypothetical protein
MKLGFYLAKNFYDSDECGKKQCHQEVSGCLTIMTPEGSDSPKP